MPAKTRYSGLDGLRGLAALSVLSRHLHAAGALYGLTLHPALTAALAPFAWTLSGTRLFLVLTGLCLTRSLLLRARAGRAPSPGEYLAARWRRLAPAYYAALALALVAPILGRLAADLPPPPAPALGQVAAHLLFAHGLWPATLYAINPSFWTLSITMQFAAALPWLVAGAERIGGRGLVAGLLGLSLLWRATVAAWWPDAPHLIDGLLPGQALAFAAGMAVAYGSMGPAWRRLGPGRVGSWATTAAVLLAAAVASKPAHFRAVTDLLYAAGHAALLVAALASAEGGGRLDRALSWPPLVRLGRISYGVYLAHDPVLRLGMTAYRRWVVHPGLGADAALVAALVVGSVGLGWCLWRSTEVGAGSGGATRRRPAGSVVEAPG